MKAPLPTAPQVVLRDFSRSLPMALLRARESVMARFRPDLRRHDLTEQQWRVLRALNAEQGPLRLGEIGERTLLSLPSLSRLLKTLEARDLVRRKVVASDLRASEILLTRAGRAIVARVAPLSEATYAGIAATIGAAEMDQLYRLLQMVADRLDGGDEAAGD